jgi:hypothetical protein
MNKGLAAVLGWHPRFLQIGLLRLKKSFRICSRINAATLTLT